MESSLEKLDKSIEGVFFKRGHANEQWGSLSVVLKKHTN